MFGSTTHHKLGFLPEQQQDTQRELVRLDALLKKEIISIEASSYTSGALTASGEVFVWGRGEAKDAPLLGSESTQTTAQPMRVQDLPSDIVALSLGFYHSAVLTSSGQVWTWGCGDHGQQGQGSTGNQPKPKFVATLKDYKIVEIACGETHTVALTDSGKVFTWGGSEYGQLGLGDSKMTATIPTEVHLNPNSDKDIKIQRIACGATHTACLTINGQVYVWGNGAALGSSSGMPIFTPQLLEVPENFSINQICCGTYVTVLLSEIGNVYTCGTGLQLGHGDSDTENVPRLVEGLGGQSIRQIAAGSRHVLCLSDTGSVYVWGKNSFGQCGPREGDHKVPYLLNTGNSPVYLIAAGENFSAILTDGVRSERDKSMWQLLKNQRILVRVLSTIIKFFYVPLKRYADIDPETILKKKKKEKGSPPCIYLMESDLNVIFYKLEAILNDNSKLLHNLDLRMNRWSAIEKVSDLFSNHLSSDMYLQFFENLPRAIAKLETLLATSALGSILKDLLKECGQKSIDSKKDVDPVSNYDLTTLLQEIIINSILSYQVKISNLVKFTPKTHFDYRDLIEASSNINKNCTLFKTTLELQQPFKNHEELSLKIDSLIEFRKCCEKTIKFSKKIHPPTSQNGSSNQMGFSETLLEMTENMRKDSQDNRSLGVLGPSVEAFAEALENTEASNTLLSTINAQFFAPMNQLIIDIDKTVTEAQDLHKQTLAIFQSYNTTQTKLQNALEKGEGKKVLLIEKELVKVNSNYDDSRVHVIGKLYEGTNLKQKSIRVLSSILQAEHDFYRNGIDRFKIVKKQMNMINMYITDLDRSKWVSRLQKIIQQSCEENKDISLSHLLVAKRKSLVEVEQSQNLSSNKYQQLTDDILASPELGVANSLIATLEPLDQPVILNSLVKVLDAYNQTIPIIAYGITNEVKRTNDSGTLFRVNSVATKLMTAFTKLTGMNYLATFVKPFVKSIIQNPAGFEINPAQIPAGEHVDTNLEKLIDTAQLLLNSILGSTESWPIPIRVISKHLQSEVTKKFPDAKHSSVGGFLFLRFICPVVLSPYDSGLISTPVSKEATRPLILIGKVLQNLSNGLMFGQKEPFMYPLNDFISNNLTYVERFFDSIANVPDDIPYEPIATLDEVNNKDVRIIHRLLVTNLGKISCSLTKYKCQNLIGNLAQVLVDLGDPEKTVG